MGMTRLRLIVWSSVYDPAFTLVWPQKNRGSLPADFNAQEDVTEELAGEAIGRMEDTDEDVGPSAGADHSDYDAREAVLGGLAAGVGVALG